MDGLGFSLDNWVGLGLGKGGKKSTNPLAHPNPLTNCPTKPTYLINVQMGASTIRPNKVEFNWVLIGLLIGHQKKVQTGQKKKKKNKEK